MEIQLQKQIKTIKPRVRNIEDDMYDDPEPSEPRNPSQIEIKLSPKNHF